MRQWFQYKGGEWSEIAFEDLRKGDIVQFFDDGYSVDFADTYIYEVLEDFDEVKHEDKGIIMRQSHKKE